MSASVRIRDAVRALLPKWMSDRDQDTGTGLAKGFKLLFVIAAAFDSGVDIVLQGIAAAWPGAGTPTALPYVGRNRGIIRGEADTNATFAARLVPWLSTWRGDLPEGGGAGSQLALAKALHEYLGNNPKVRVVNRHGYWTTVNEDGSIERVSGVTFSWDALSNTENYNHWWDQWVIIYPGTYAEAAAWGATESWGGTLGFGMDVDRPAVDAILGQIRQWKRASTYIRAVIWSYDASLFDPAVPASLPDGWWGKSHKMVGGIAVPTRPATCRFWEGIG